VFLALPEAASAELVPALAARGTRVFDLSGAFRLREAGARARWYPSTPDLDVGILYGLTERCRAALADARVVSCPGCYPTAALLPLEPLAAAGALDGDVVIDAKSGISGAGKKPSEKTHFSERHGSVAAYGVLAHRHSAEIEQELQHAVTFVPHLVPMTRGILSTTYARLRDGVGSADVDAVYEDRYGGEPFVHLADEPPRTKWTTGTNHCFVQAVADEATGTLIAMSAIDNLGKGAAGAALQNANLVLGLDEQAGLGIPAGYP
jgi:N-acetyl-gamma-glutamyl-phosphate reductase